MAYGGQAMKKSSIFGWHKWFKECCENIEENERNDYPIFCRTDENVKKLRNLVHSGRRVSVSTMAVQLNLGKETVKKPELWPNDWILHHDNVPVHKVLCQAILGPKIYY
jgi:hypothetical protein